MINKVILVGRLGQDPSIKYTPSGAAVCNFSVATSEYWKDNDGGKQERTEWSKIVAWGKTAETCNAYLAKGSLVYLEGKLATRSWDKDGVKQYCTEIIAKEVKFLDSKQGQNKGQQSSQETPETPSGSHFTADDIPF